MIRFITIAIVLLASIAFADIPHLLNYQGRITDDSGTPMDGSHELTFRIYDDSTGGTTLWAETHLNVTVTDGLFDVVLGSIATLESSVFSTQPRWLGIQVDLGTELSPRTQVLAVAYAYHADRADTADYAIGGGSPNGWADDGSNVRLRTVTDKVGIGVNDPQEKLHVNGDIRLGYTSDIAFGDDNTRLHVQTGGDMVLEANDDIHLEPVDDVYIHQGTGSAWVHYDGSSESLGINATSPAEKLHVVNAAGFGRSFLQLEVSHASAWGECGIRIVNPSNKWHLRMDDYDNYNLPVEGSLALRSNNSGKEVMTWTNAGDVGIGDTSPDAKLDVNGDLEVTGAYRGTISSTSGGDGAPFPRPAYDSGWFSITSGDTLLLTHNIGGNVDNYFVDLQIDKGDVKGGISNDGIGGEVFYTGTESYRYGYRYSYLTTNTITIKREDDDVFSQAARVRIWVIE